MSESISLKHEYSMADVSAKPVSRRLAMASGKITLGEEAYTLLKDGSLPKGDALALAEFAGIQAAKRTPSLIPLCHPIALNRTAIFTRLLEGEHAVEVFSVAEIDARTGVEMEALCGLNIALLTIWDLAKPINAALRIDDIKLLCKTGGKRGDWVHPDGLPDAAKAVLDDF